METPIMSSMTRAQRMFAAMRFQPVDRVPYSTYNCHPYGRNEHTDDPSYGRILENVRARAGATTKLGLRGGLGLGLTRVRPGLVETLTKEYGEGRLIRTVIHTPKGDLESVTKAPEHQPSMTIKPLFTTDEDMDKYMSVPYEPPEFDATPLREFIQSAAGRAVPFVQYDEPMSEVGRNLEMEGFSIRCLTDLPSVKRMIDWAYERCEDSLRRMVSACKGIECVFLCSGPERCTPPMLAPHFYAELVLPYHKKLNRIIRDGGLLVGLHCHGRLRDVFPYIVESGVQVLEPVEPPDQGDIALAELMRQARGKTCLMGYIQDQELYTASPGHMTRKVEEIARVVDGGTGYIMCSTCTPFAHPCPETYERNYLEWLDAGEKFLA
jgi:hypothetical protein